MKLKRLGAKFYVVSLTALFRVVKLAARENKFYEELSKVKHLCADMDISIEEIPSKPVPL